MGGRYSIDEQIEEIDHLIALRGQTFPKMVQDGRMAPEASKRRLGILVSVRATLEACRERDVDTIASARGDK